MTDDGRKWLAVDLVGGALVHMYTSPGQRTYRIDLDGLDGSTVLINLTDDERAQWVAVLREETPS
jgi:hypothetical protein